MQLVSTITVDSSNVSSISFTGIPQTARDILVVASVRQNAGSVIDQVEIRVNNNASSVYSYVQLYGTGTSRATVSRSSQFIWEVYGNGTSATANTFASLSMYIPNYATSLNKCTSIDVVAENNGTEAWQTLLTGRWDNGTAISSVQLNTRDISLFFTIGSTASLYIIS